MEELAALFLRKLLGGGGGSAAVFHVFWDFDGKESSGAWPFFAFVDLAEAVLVLHIEVIFEIIFAEGRLDNEREGVLNFRQFDRAHVVGDLEAEAGLEEGVASDEFGAELLEQELLELSQL